MKIIALIGPKDSGKTSTMELVYNLLNAEGHETIKPIVFNGKDFTAVFKYKGKRIAIFTLGDYINSVKNAIQESSVEKTDVLICAIRSTIFEYISVRDELFKHTPTIFDKTINKTDNNWANRYDAEKIINKLSKHCNIKGNGLQIKFGMSEKEIKVILSQNLDIGDALQATHPVSNCYETIDVEGVPFSIYRCIDGGFSVSLWKPIQDITPEMHKKIIDMKFLLESASKKVFAQSTSTGMESDCI